MEFLPNDAKNILPPEALSEGSVVADSVDDCRQTLEVLRDGTDGGLDFFCGVSKSYSLNGLSVFLDSCKIDLERK